MDKSVSIASLFAEEPDQWGLRGDPYLWREMAIYFKNRPLPDSAEALTEQIEKAFAEITGKPITVNSNFHIERFSHGGMSSGGVSPDFWKNTAIPLLISRYHGT